MIAVLFEVSPNDGKKSEYLEIAASLRPELEQIEGFLSIERFQSISDPTRILSLSFWRDEEAVRQWRNLKNHRQAQQNGREGIFRDYRLRIAEVIRDYGMFNRYEVPGDSRKKHDGQE
jgi:heme-degrading monooxygenase HmoA